MSPSRNCGSSPSGARRRRARRPSRAPGRRARYFPSAQATWQEAAFELAEGRWDPADVARAGSDPGARLERVVTTLGWHMLDDEAPFRLRALAGLEAWFDQLGRPDEDRVPVRRGRRTEWIDRVVEPVRGRLGEDELEAVGDALALVWGTEAVIALRDVRGLDADGAKASMLRAARWMLAGALADLGVEGEPPKGGGRRASAGRAPRASAGG